IYNTSFLGEYECSSLALDRRRKKVEDEIGSFKTRLNCNSAVFIARENQRILWAVPAVPDISGGRPAYQGAAPMEFWCTAQVELTTPLKNSIIKFIVKNGKTSLTFNFETFVKANKLDYNNGAYIAQPQTDVMKVELLQLGLHSERNEIVELQCHELRRSVSISDYDPSSPRPLAKPPDDDEIELDTGLLTTKVVGDISEHYVLIPRLLPTQPNLCPVIQTLLPFLSENVDKVHLLSHRGFKTSKLSLYESPMLISGDNTPNLGVRHPHFYPP
ncbi:hypothetical protein Tco_0517763, partial [Tanacetum coccineum]